mgnify:CR=1 FL=1
MINPYQSSILVRLVPIFRHSPKLCRNGMAKEQALLRNNRIRERNNSKQKFRDTEEGGI